MSVADVATPDLLPRLETLLAAFARLPVDVRATLKQWNHSRPEEFARAGVRHLSRGAAGPPEKYLARLLATTGTYLKYLLSPTVVSGLEAIAAARVLSAVDMSFYLRLMETYGEHDRAETIHRIFQLILALDRTSLVVPWLQRMTRHDDPRVQSKASLIFCRLYANPSLVERQLTSPDPRVRANAVEALWRVDKLPCRAILEKAVNDPHHRVALNAALGLYYLSDMMAIEQMIAFAGHPDPLFRAAAAWAMGQTADRAFQPHLEALATDPVERVRTTAEHALRRKSEEVISAAR